MKLGVVPITAVAVTAQHFPGISFVGSQLNRFTSLFASDEPAQLARHQRDVSSGVTLKTGLSCTAFTSMPDISGSRRRRRDIDSSGEADYELVTSTMPIDDEVDVEMMLGPENTTMGPRKMKRMMKRARKPTPTSSDESRGDQRIVGGQESTASVWKWIVHFPDVGCGGTIISYNWVLTAAHCCHGTNPYRYRTMTNEWDVNLSTGDENEYYPSQIIRHPAYNATTMSNDFCLLRYTENLLTPTTVEPACLPDQGVAPAIRNLTDTTIGNCHVAGWGVTNTTTGASSSFLQEVEVEIIDIAACNNATAYNGTLDDSMLCAGTMGGGFDACQGDSGGPLICEDLVNNVPVLEGVVSWGEGCAKADRPGIYGAVNSVVDWIANVTTDVAPDGWQSGTYHEGNTADLSVASCGDMSPMVGYSGNFTLQTNNDTGVPLYGNNLQCTWTIRVPIGMLVQVNITDLDVEHGPSCEYDRLQFVAGTETIWTGSGPNGAAGRALHFDDDYYNWYEGENLIRNVCGNMTTNDNMIVAQSTSNEMTVIFTSDTDVTGSGFVLSYEAVGQENRFDDNCGVNVEDGRNGTLSSPMMAGKKGGETYEPNSSCQWTIDVGELQAGEVVEVTFDEFELEGGSNKDPSKACPYDYLEIESSDLFGKNPEKDLRRLCGSEHPGILTFTGRKVFFRFTTDSTTQFKGFKLSWNVKSTIIKVYSYRDAQAYTVVTRPRTFEEAVIDCEGLGLQLTRLRSDDSAKALIDELKNKDIEGEFYIGLRRHQEMDRFFSWIDGQSVHGDGVYSGWHDGHPTADAGCGYIDTVFPAKNEKEKGRWRASACEEQRNYICGKKYTAVEDCPLDNLPPNTELRNETCQKNVPGWRGSACGLQCKPGFFMMPVETGAKIPKKIRATCVKPRRLDTYSWIIKSKVSFVCQKDCPYPHGQPNASVKFVERSWDEKQNTTNTALLVIVNFQSKNPVNGWTSRLTFHGGNITDVEFSSYSAELIQKDVITSSVVFTSNTFNAEQKGVFAYLIRVVQPAGNDILSDQKNLDDFQYQWDPVEDSMVTTYYIEGQIDGPIDMSCGAPPQRKF